MCALGQKCRPLPQFIMRMRNRKNKGVAIFVGHAQFDFKCRHFYHRESILSITLISPSQARFSAVCFVSCDAVSYNRGVKFPKYSGPGLSPTSIVSLWGCL